MMMLNPLIASRDKAQHVCWKHLKNGTTYNVTLIQPLNAMIQEVDDGGYMVCPARINEDRPLNAFSVGKDDCVVIDFPIKTFQRSWEAIPWKVRHSITIDDNVTMTFLKKSQKDIRMTKLSVEKATIGDVEFAKKIIENSIAYVSQKIKYAKKSQKVEEVQE